jgi:ribonuclease VapC
MIIDTSALVAILRDEPEAEICTRAIESAAERRVSTVNFVEAAVVIDGSRDPIASRRFNCSERHASASRRSPKFRPGLLGTLIEISVKAADIWPS